jgi:hypothetical protein
MTTDGTDPDSPDEPAKGGLAEFVNASLQSAGSSNNRQDRPPHGAAVASAAVGLGCGIPLTLLGIVGVLAIVGGTSDMGALALSTLLIVGIPLLVAGIVGMAFLRRSGQMPSE